MSKKLEPSLVNRWWYGPVYGMPFGVKYDVKDKDTNITLYQSYFIDRLCQLFKIKGELPETIPERDFKLLLFTAGVIGYQKVDKLGDKNGEYVFNVAPAGAPTVTYMPSRATIANAALNYSGDFEIGKEIAIIRCDSMGIGFMPLITKYASLLAEADITLQQQLYVMRNGYAITAENDSGKRAADKYIKDLEAGEVTAIGSQKMLQGMTALPQIASTRLTDIIEIKQYLIASFFNEIGLDANYNMKRESINSGEAQLNKDALTPLIDDVIASIKDGFAEVKRLYGRELDVELSSAWKDNEIELKAAQNEITKDPEPELEIEPEPETETEVTKDE